MPVVVMFGVVIALMLNAILTILALIASLVHFMFDSLRPHEVICVD